MNVQFETESSVWRNRRQVASLGMDLQTVAKNEIAKTLRSEMRWKWQKWNRIALGGCVAKVMGTTSAGVKMEDKIHLGDSMKVRLPL